MERIVGDRGKARTVKVKTGRAPDNFFIKRVFMHHFLII